MTTVFSVTVLFLVAIVGQLLKSPPPPTGVLAHHCRDEKKTGSNGDVVLLEMLKISWTELVSNEKVLG